MSTDTPAPIRDPLPLYGWLRVFVVIYAVVVTILVGFNTGFYVISRGDPVYEPISPTDMLITLGFAGVAVLSLLIFAVCVVLTLRITFRMMKNLHTLGSPHVSISPGWAAGWYFIPFANLVMPVKAVGEIWRGTYDQLGTHKPPNGAIGRWWGCWIGGSICDSIAERLVGGGWFGEPTFPSQEALYAAMALWGVGTLLSVLACIFMLNVFGQLARGQQQMARTSAF